MERIGASRNMLEHCDANKPNITWTIVTCCTYAIRQRQRGGPYAFFSF